MERAKIGAEAINAGLINKTDWRDSTTRKKFLDSDVGRPYGERYNAVSEETVMKTNQGRRQLRMGLAVGGHFAGMIGQSLQEAGYEKAGGAFNILGGTLGGAASGAMMGGPFGAAIGGMVGMITTTTAELTKMAKAAEEAAAKMNALGRSEQGQWFEHQNDQRLTAL